MRHELLFFYNISSPIISLSHNVLLQFAGCIVWFIVQIYFILLVGVVALCGGGVVLWHGVGLDQQS